MREFKQPDGKYEFVFGRYAKPIATIKPGEEVAIYTEDAFSGRLTGPDVPSSVLFEAGYMNPQTGPFYIEGAEPGDTLVVEILDIQPATGYAGSALIPGFGGVVATSSTPMLNEPLPEKCWLYKYDESTKKFTSTTDPALSFDYKPFYGTVTTAPELESISTATPFSQGGNMDCRDTCPGNKVMLPVAVEGAYFFLGDAHGAQGDGELCGTALEMPAKGILKFSLIKGKKLHNVRIENDEYIMCVGTAKPMEDAARMAYVDLIEWMGEYGWNKYDAFECLTQAGEMYVGNMVDTFYSLVGKIKKEIVMRKKK